MSSTSFGVYLISGTTYSNLTQNGHVWIKRPESGRPAYLLWNLGMKLYQSHLEGEFRPIQWVVSQNIQVGIGRLEPTCKVKEPWSMIREQDNYPFRSNLRPLRSVSVQWRAEKPTEPSRLAQDDVGWANRQKYRPPEAVRAIHAKSVGTWHYPRPAGLGEAARPHLSSSKDALLWHLRC